MPAKCSKCQMEIKAGEANQHQFNIVCEECMLDARAARKRKTHWQYLKSIKTDYLIPAKKD